MFHLQLIAGTRCLVSTDLVGRLACVAVPASGIGLGERGMRTEWDGDLPIDLAASEVRGITSLANPETAIGQPRGFGGFYATGDPVPSPPPIHTWRNGNGNGNAEPTCGRRPHEQVPRWPAPHARAAEFTLPFTALSQTRFVHPGGEKRRGSGRSPRPITRHITRQIITPAQDELPRSVRAGTGEPVRALVTPGTLRLEFPSVDGSNLNDHCVSWSAVGGACQSDALSAFTRGRKTLSNFSRVSCIHA